MASNDNIAKILVFIGGILSVIQGFFTIFGLGGWWSGFFAILFGILGILVGLALIVSADYLKINLPFKIPFEKIPLLIIGILILIFGSYIGGILLIIAAVLLFL